MRCGQGSDVQQRGARWQRPSPADKPGGDGHPGDTAGAGPLGVGLLVPLAAAEADQVDGEEEEVEAEADGGHQAEEKQRLRRERGRRAARRAIRGRGAGGCWVAGLPTGRSQGGKRKRCPSTSPSPRRRMGAELGRHCRARAALGMLNAGTAQRSTGGARTALPRAEIRCSCGSAVPGTGGTGGTGVNGGARTRPPREEARFVPAAGGVEAVTARRGCLFVSVREPPQHGARLPKPRCRMSGGSAMGWGDPSPGEGGARRAGSVPAGIRGPAGGRRRVRAAGAGRGGAARAARPPTRAPGNRRGRAAWRGRAGLGPLMAGGNAPPRRAPPSRPRPLRVATPTEETTPLQATPPSGARTACCRASGGSSLPAVGHRARCLIEVSAGSPHPARISL